MHIRFVKPDIKNDTPIQNCCAWNPLTEIMRLSWGFISEASSGDAFAFSTLRPPRCMKWMGLIGLMITF